MGSFAQVTADEYQLTRENQDDYSIESLRRAQEAITSGAFKDEIVPVTISSRKGEVISARKGDRIDTGRLLRRRRTPMRAQDSAWWRFAHRVSGRPWPYLLAATAVLLALAAPALGMQLAFPDAGDEPTTTTHRRAYDLLADGFGPGVNGPLLIVADLRTPGLDTETLPALTERIIETYEECGGINHLGHTPLPSYREVVDILVSCTVVLKDGIVEEWPAGRLGYTYRHSELPEGAIVVEATFRGEPGKPEAVGAEMDAIARAREESQPLRSRTGGSTFKNPPGHKAWALIDAAGCRGMMLGGAQVSEKHCNFLLNTGSATSSDIEALGEEVRRRVMAKTNIMLEWEIQRVGESE